MPLTMLCSVSVGDNHNGHTQLLGLDTSRYRRLRTADVVQAGVYANISSSRVYQSGSVDATLILVDNQHVLSRLPDFHGKFLQISCTKEASSYTRVDHLSAFGFDNRARNLIEVGANSTEWEQRTSFRTMFLDYWNGLLDQFVFGSDEPPRRSGDAIFSWSMWPTGLENLDPNLIYLMIKQPLKIVLNNWRDYSATVTFYIRLYVDAQGRVRSQVARHQTWVSSGLKHDWVSDHLVWYVENMKALLEIDALPAMLEQEFGVGNSSVYYLPGNQVVYPGNVFAGSTLDDVTIVVTP